MEDETPLGKIDHRPGIGVGQIGPRIALSREFQFLEQLHERSARRLHSRGIGAVIDDIVNFIAQSPGIGRSLFAVFITGIRIIQQNVIRSSGLKIFPRLGGVGIHLLIEQRHFQRYEFPVFPVRIDRHRNSRLLRSGVERRRGRDGQRRLAEHRRPPRRGVDHRFGDTRLHDLERPGLPEEERLIVGSRHRQGKLVEDGKRELLTAEQLDGEQAGLRIVHHRLESRTVTDDNLVTHGIDRLVILQKQRIGHSAVEAHEPLAVGRNFQLWGNSFGAGFVLTAGDRPRRNIFAVDFQSLGVRTAFEAYGPVALGVDPHNGNQRLDLLAEDDGQPGPVAQFDLIALGVGLDADDNRRFVHQAMERLDRGIHAADLRFQRGHAVAQVFDLVADTVGIFTRLQNQGRNRCNPQKQFVHIR